MIFQSIKTSRLKKDQISQIIKLKNTYWDYGKNSQIKWFNKNAYPNDLHNLVFYTPGSLEHQSNILEKKFP